MKTREMKARGMNTRDGKIYTTYDLQRSMRVLLDEALCHPVRVRRRGERFVIISEDGYGLDRDDGGYVRECVGGAGGEEGKGVGEGGSDEGSGV